MQICCPLCNTRFDHEALGDLQEIACPSCGSSFRLISAEETLPNPPETEPAPREADREIIGNFELMEQIGGGAFGFVWKARDRQLDRLVAVKIPRKGQLGSDETERFLREARSAAQLRHPNIVSVHEVGRDRGTVFIVSDFVEGVTLAERLKTSPYPVSEAVDLCAKIADAVHYAHEMGVIHRDLKPGNIILDADGQPHIVDFGLARREVGDVTMTVEGHILGTPAYMSPEQARGSSHAADRRSDIYSIGVVLFELLTGERPFRGNTRMLVHQVINDPPPSPRRSNARLSRDLETVCLKCLDKKPGQRYQRASGLSVDLKRYLRGEPILARPVSKMEHFVRWVRRNPVVAGLLATVFAVLVAGTFISTYFRSSANKQAEQAAVNLQQSKHNQKRAEAARQDAKTAQQEEEAARVEKARQLAFSFLDRGRSRCEQHRTGEGLLWMVRALETLPSDNDLGRHAIRANLSSWYQRSFRRRALTGPRDRLMKSFAFSPDGTQLAVGDAQLAAGDEGRVRFCEARTLKWVGEDLRLEQNVIFVSFSPDGQKLLTLESPRGLSTGQFGVGQNVDYLSWPEDTTRAQLWDLPARTPIGPPLECAGAVLGSVGYDGERVLLAVQAESSINVWDVASAERIAQIEGPRGGAGLSPDGKHLAAPISGSIKIWDLDTQNLVVTAEKLGLFRDARVQYSSDGALLAVLHSVGAKIAVLDARSGTRLCQIDMPQHSISFRFVPNSETLATVNGSRIYFWDVRSGRQVGEELTISQNGKILAVSTNCRDLIAESSGIWLWSKEPDVGITAVEKSEFPQRIEHGGSDRWNEAREKTPPPKTIPRPGSAPVFRDGFVFSCDAEIAVRLKGGRAQIWKMGDEAAQQPLSEPLPMENITLAVFSANGKYLATADKTGTARVWKVPSGEPVGELCRPRADASYAVRPDATPSRHVASSPVRSIVVHPQGQFLAVESERDRWNHSMRIFSVLSGQTASRMIQHEGGIGARIFSPDGQMFATGSLDQTVRLWDAQTGMQVGATLRLQRQVGDVCFSKDGRSLFVQAGGQTYRASLPPPVSASRDNVRLAVEVATGLKIDEGGTVLTQMDDEWHLRKEKLSAHATPVFGGPEANESDGDPSSGRTPEELDARRKAYLDKYLKALAEFRKHDVPPETHSKQFPPHVELHADMSTDGMNVKLYSDWECRREVDREYLEAREARKRRDNAASVKIRYPPMPTHYKAYFDKKGHRRQVEAHGTDGRMTSHVGYAAVRYWYDEQDNCVQETHLDVEGNVTENLRSIATAYHVYDNGERKETRFYNEEGKPDEDFLGVHRRLYRAADTLEYRLDDTQRIRWLEPINLGKRINGKAAWYPCVGSDGKELYYAMGWTGTRKTEPFGIHRIRWEENRWSDPQPVLAGGNPLVGTSPAISSDDQFLAFIAWKSHPADGRSRLRKATNLDESDVYISEWSDAGWQAVRNAGQEVNERTQGTVTFYPGTHDLLVTGWQTDSQWKQHKYLARHSYRAGDGKWMARAPVEIEKTPGFGNHIRGPSFPREESAMCFSFSSGGAGYGSGDLWYTTLEEGRWTRPVNLGTPVNTGSEEGMPALFPNGDILYFDAIRSHSDAVGTHSSTWNILATGRADSETAIRHLADIYADSDLPAPP